MPWHAASKGRAIDGKQLMRRIGQAGVVLLLLAAAIVVPTTAAQACKCAQGTPAELFERSDAVFLGEVVERSDAPVSAEYPSAFVYEFAVDRVYQGSVAEQANVIAGGNANLCGIRMQTGESYLVFAHTATLDATQTSYATSGCSGTRTSTTAPASFGEGVAPAAEQQAPADESGEPIDNTPQVLAGLAGSVLMLALLGALVLAIVRLRRHWGSS